MRGLSPFPGRAYPPVMRGPRLLGRLGVASTAAAGVVIGHTLTYLVLFADGNRHAVLARTGHGYWEFALALAALLSVVSVVTTILRHFRSGRRSVAAAGLPFWGFVARLLPLQVGLFLALEVGERLATGGLHISTHRLALVGSLLQVAVGLGLAFGLRALARLARAVGAALASRPAQRRNPAFRPLRSLHVAPSLLDGARTLRGPPAPVRT